MQASDANTNAVIPAARNLLEFKAVIGPLVSKLDQIKNQQDKAYASLNLKSAAEQE